MISLFLVLLISQSFTPGHGLCKEGYQPWIRSWDRDGSCIKIIRNSTGHQQAVNKCKDEGGVLLKLWEDTADLLALSSVLDNITTDEIWLGGVTEKIWHWSEDGLIRSNDTLITHGYWLTGEPNNQGAGDRIQLMQLGKLKWNDEASSSTHHGLGFQALCSCRSCKGQNMNFLQLKGIEYFIPTRDGMNWAEAFEECKKYGGKLAKIESEDVQNLIENRTDIKSCLWIAGYWNGHYRLSWLSGKPITKDRSVRLSNPDNITQRLCAYAVKTRDGNFKLDASQNCNMHKPFICEESVTTESTTQRTIPSENKNASKSDEVGCIMRNFSKNLSTSFKQSSLLTDPPELPLAGTGLVLIGALVVSCGLNLLLCCLLIIIHHKRSMERRATAPLSDSKLLKEQAWT